MFNLFKFRKHDFVVELGFHRVILSIKKLSDKDFSDDALIKFCLTYIAHFYYIAPKKQLGLMDRYLRDLREHCDEYIVESLEPTINYGHLELANRLYASLTPSERKATDKIFYGKIGWPIYSSVARDEMYYDKYCDYRFKFTPDSEYPSFRLNMSHKFALIFLPLSVSAIFSYSYHSFSLDVSRNKLWERLTVLLDSLDGKRPTIMQRNRCLLKACAF